jgi:pyruvate dehydrogenase E2 component (dihydrolipoamide acetyltransferase)
MATAVVMPRQGQSVESCIIVEWKKQVGENVAEGDVLCDVETDKATLEVTSPGSGVLLAQLFEAGADVPVLTTIAVVGAEGEDISSFGAGEAPAAASVMGTAAPVATASAEEEPARFASVVAQTGTSFVSPRARGIALQRGLDATALAGSGPGRRVIERDVLAAIAAQPRLTPVAKAMVAEGGFAVPAQGSGPGGRVTARDLAPSQMVEPEVATSTASSAAYVGGAAEEFTRTQVKGVRKIIAERMLQSLQSTAQLTMNASADARSLQSLRKRLKESSEAMGLRGITINDLVLFAVARALTLHPDLNAHFVDNEIRQYGQVNLGFAVDTPRGLIVPVIRNANSLTLRQLASEAKRLAAAAVDGKVAPDDLAGGTFTVTNLGGFGIESFTPVLNAPQVGILGVGNIQLRPVEGATAIEFVSHLGLSLTINHQVVDGAPGARFLQTVALTIANLDLALAG